MSDASATTTAAQRIATALKTGGYTKEWRGPNREIQHIKLSPLDIVEACESASNPDDQIVIDLKLGSTRAKRREAVVIKADDAFHLVEQATPAPAVVVPQSPAATPSQAPAAAAAAAAPAKPAG